MSISNNLQRAQEWAAVVRDHSATEQQRDEARLNVALFERDYFAEILQSVHLDAYRAATEMLHPGSTAMMIEILQEINRH